MKSIYRPMIKSTYRLEITKAKAWEIDPEVGGRFKWAEHALMTHYDDYSGNTTVVCILESVEIIPIPATYGQVRRAPSGLSFTCIGIDDDCVWLKSVFQRIQRTKAVFETWPLEES